jgi:hypothetical protein
MSSFRILLGAIVCLACLALGCSAHVDEPGESDASTRSDAVVDGDRYAGDLCMPECYVFQGTSNILWNPSRDRDGCCCYTSKFAFGALVRLSFSPSYLLCKSGVTPTYPPFTPPHL